MKIVFWGTSQFAIYSLEKIFKVGHEILLVVTQPDKKQGRHLEVKESPVKNRAKELNLNIVQPEDIKDKDFENLLKSLKSELFVVVSYGKIIPKKILEIPKLFSINLHASLLPKYRGGAPINWAILNGEKETGLTVFRINEKMDAGDIIVQKKVPILEEDNAITLGERLSKEGADLLLETIELIEKGEANFLPQDESKVSFAPLLKRENGRIKWEESAEKINNQIRALVPWPGSFCYWQGKLLKIWRTKIVNDNFSNFQIGEIADIQKDGFIVTTGKGGLFIEELQLEGGRRMSARNFLLGHCLKKGEVLR